MLKNVWQLRIDTHGANEFAKGHMCRANFSCQAHRMETFVVQKTQPMELQTGWIRF